MTTPLADFLKAYAGAPWARLHMPGHKGRLRGPLAQAAPFDITEIEGADSLFEAEGVLRESEENAAALYGSGLTCYSAGGSTLCIQTMVALTCGPGDRILAGRNAHHSFLNACALLDVLPEWILPRYNDSFGVSGELTPEAVADALQRWPDAKAVYVTSPDYLGCVSDIRAIGELCRRAGKPLLVDNAHGAHLRFTREDRHPLTLGASLCCDSAHKTLPVLTGGAYLHVSRDYPLERELVKSRMGLFGSTSPSYLILLSLDLCNAYLAGQARSDFSRLEEAVQMLCGELGLRPISPRWDFSKLTLDAWARGMSGEELAGFLRSRGIECEYAARRHTVLMLSPGNSPEDWARLRAALEALPAGEPLREEAEPFRLPERVLTPRRALFAPQERVPVDDALGRIAGETRIKCPPGVPVVAAGEKIGKDTQKILKISGIPAINVIK